MIYSKEFEKVINSINANIDLLPGECERWIRYHHGAYRITNFGRVLSCNYLNQKGVMRWLRPWFGGLEKYLCVYLRNRKPHYIHHLVLEHFDRLKEPNEECRHLDGNNKNNKWWNLIWGTPSQNQFDRIKHGTYQYCEQNPNCLISNEKLKQLLKDWGTGLYTQKQLGDKYNLAQATISKYINGDLR